MLVKFIVGVILSAMSGLALCYDINVALSSAPNNLVPFYATDANSQNINRLLHLALIGLNDKMQIECSACESFSERMSEGKHIIHFKMRHDLLFSDDTKVTAEDVRRSWIYLAKDKQIKSTHMGAFDPLEEIKILGPYELEMIFRAFSLENLSNLSLLKIIKLKKGPSADLSAADIIGCGEYTLGEVTPLEIRLDPRNKDRPHFVFKVVKDETTLALKLIKKEIDLSTASISPRKVEWLKNMGHLKIFERPSGNFIFLAPNHKREMFKDINVRRALSLLIPRKEILRYKLKNTAVLSNGMFSPAFVDMYSPIAPDSYDPALALELLFRSGYRPNAQGFLEKDKKELEIDWKVSNNKSSIEMVEVMKYYLEKAGIKVNVSVLEWGTYMNAFKGGHFDIVMGQWIGLSGPQMLRFVFHSASAPPKGGNRTGYKNPEIDELIDSATMEINADKRNQLYRSALQKINEDYAYINLWHPNIIWIGNDCLEKVELDSTGGFAPLLKLTKKTEGKCGK